MFNNYHFYLDFGLLRLRKTEFYKETIQIDE